MTIRPAERTDQPTIRSILQTIELFPPEMLSKMMSPYLTQPETGHQWYVLENEAEVIGFAYAVPEPLTAGTYNLLAIGINAQRQGRGAGSQLMQYAEDVLKRQGARLLIVDTSGTGAFTATRKFYKKLGYTKEAVIRDYWAEGDDKVVFWKRL